MAEMSIGKRVSYAVGGLGKDMAFALSNIMFFYFTDTIQISPTFVGFLFMIVRVWDAINDPVMGLIVDNTKTRFGKFRPWILIGTLVNSVVSIMIFSNPNLSGLPLLIFISFAYIIWGMSYTMMDIPYWAMLPTFTFSQKERESISVLTRVFTSIGFFIVAAPFLKIVDLLGGGNDVHGFFYMTIIISIIFIITIIQMVVVVDAKHTLNNQSVTLKDMFLILRKNDQLQIVMLTVIVFNSVVYITSQMGIYFFKYDIGNENYYALFVTVAGLSLLTSISIYPLLSKIMERKDIFRLAIIVPVISYGGLFFSATVLKGNIIALILSGIILFLGLGLTQILQTVMLADTVEYGEWKLGKRCESINFSIQTFVVKFGTAVSSFIVGIGLDLVGYDGLLDVQSTTTIYGIRVIMFVLPVFGLFFAYWLFNSKYKLTKDFYHQVLVELGKI